MKTKILFIVLTLMLLTTSQFAAHATDKTSEQESTQVPDKPMKGIGIILINANDSNNVILLTKVQVKDNPEGKMIGIPIILDEMGKKIVEEYGIVGIGDNEPNGMDRIQKESATKVVFVEGNIQFNGNSGKLAIMNYGSALDLKK